MTKLTRTVSWGAAAAIAGLIAVLATVNSASWAMEQEPAPPEGQTYVGAKRCASCHFQEFLTWKKDKHSSAFELLPPKYQSDAKCLKCHTTGYGEETGWKSRDDKGLAGVTCEMCHGPGSKHAEIAQPFVLTKKLTPGQQKPIVDSIWRFLPKRYCIECHSAKVHKTPETPPELLKK